MAKGAVKFFSAVLGFGVITPDDGTPDVVVLMAALEASGLSELIVGEDVSFQVQADRRFGMQLVTVTKVYR